MTKHDPRSGVSAEHDPASPSVKKLRSARGLRAARLSALLPAASLPLAGASSFPVGTFGAGEPLGAGIDMLFGTKPAAGGALLPYRTLYQVALAGQADIAKRGIRPRVLKRLAEDLRLEQTVLLDRLGLARSTFSRKLRDGEALGQSESERVLGLLRLVGQVQQMVEESGDATDFDASAWVGAWIEQPVPALADRAPSAYLDTAAGQELISQLLRQSQSGAFA